MTAMNAFFKPAPTLPRKTGARLVPCIASLCLCLLMAGCSFLKPARPTARFYVLTPLPPSTAAPAPADASITGLGLGPVKVASYLFNTSMAVRRGANEVDYLASTVWAERLDTGFQRVLASDLATVLPTDRLLLSAWQMGDVAMELHVVVEQFDVAANGQGQLVARWRIVSPGGESILKSGSTRLTRQGPVPDTDAPGAVATLSDLVADFSRQLAVALRETAPVPKTSSNTLPPGP
jgi:uncharacterized lipoprotein YmbA